VISTIGLPLSRARSVPFAKNPDGGGGGGGGGAGGGGGGGSGFLPVSPGSGVLVGAEVPELLPPLLRCVW
jgi:hypothetical protein